MPDLTETPDLSGATDAALSAFLHRELFDESELVLRPAVDVWDEVAHYDPEFHTEPDHPAWPFLAYEIDGEAFYDALDDLCTPSGALRVIEAMGESWIGSAEHDGVKWTGVLLSKSPSPRKTFWAHADTFPRAVCEAAVLALLPAASEEGRRILNSDG